jgi:hypothetical protein
MSAVAFFYAGSLAVQWQLLIVVIFLFFGTLAFFVVLFDETPVDALVPIVTATIQDEDNEHVGFQNYAATSDA